jgi:ABC-type transport system involved in cytochrome c biogenesis permease subunit
VTYYRGDTGTCTLSQGKVQFGYLTSQQKVAHFPFDLTLDSAKVIYHPNTETAKDFVAYIQVRDKTHGEVRWGKISMNQIYRAGGYRLCLQALNASANSCTLSVNHDPWGIGLTYAGYAMLALSMIFFFTEKKSRWRSVIRANKAMLLPSFLSIGILSVLITYLMSTPDAGEQLPPVLDSPLLGIHIFTIITAYLLLLSVALLSIAALCLRGQGERVQTRRRAFHTLCEIWLTPAVFLLAIGIFIGAIWANVSWGRYWGWDPKETWALVTLMIYALPMHRLSFPLFRTDKWFHLYCILAFASILMTYFGVNHLLGGLHSYGG